MIANMSPLGYGVTRAYAASIYLEKARHGTSFDGLWITPRILTFLKPSSNAIATLI
jgi:hypothetical protein